MSLKVSVIITTYNNQGSLTRAIDSVLNQTYKNIEIIVVDDNGNNTDGRTRTEKLMDKYKDNSLVKYICHYKNSNGAVARNTGIRNSTGDYISFLDDDDEYLNTKIEKQIDLLKKLDSSYAGIVCGVLIKRFGVEVKTISNERKKDLKRELLLKNFNLGTGSNIFIKSSIIKELNGFNKNFIRHQDIEFMIRVLRNYRLEIDNQIMIVKHDDIKCNYPNSYKLESVKKYFLDEFKNDIDNYEEDVKNRIYFTHYYELCKACARDKRVKDCHKYIKIINKYKYITLKEYLIIFIELISSVIPLRKLKITFIRIKYKLKNS